MERSGRAQSHTWGPVEECRRVGAPGSSQLTEGSRPAASWGHVARLQINNNDRSQEEKMPGLVN